MPAKQRRIALMGFRSVGKFVTIQMAQNICLFGKWVGGVQAGRIPKGFMQRRTYES